MITLFRRIRQKLIDSGSVTKYILYAIGEIFLVVIGILIALQVNNWNEQRKANAFEITMLKEVDLALAGDSTLIAAFFEPRMDIKEKAIDSLMLMAATQKVLTAEEFMSLYEEAKIKFDYRFNSGPYETIKSNGLDLISSNELRKELTNIYEVTLPAFEFFIEYVEKSNLPEVIELEKDFLGVEYLSSETGEWELHDIPKVNNVLTDPSYKRALLYENQIALNYKSRLNSIKKIRAELHKKVRDELKRRGGL